MGDRGVVEGKGWRLEIRGWREDKGWKWKIRDGDER